MAVFTESEELKELARKIIQARDEVRHIDVNEILFLSEKEILGKAAARCYSFFNHPIKFFTPARFAIVFYESNIDYFSPDQRAILMFHELQHIPLTGDKLVDHDIKDFYDVLKLGIGWSLPGAKVPKIIEGEEDEKE